MTVGDVVQTRDNGVANINAPGATVVVESNTIVRFQSGGFALDRGSVSVATGKGMGVFARDLKITPLSSDWTEFYVTRVSGSIQIIARKNSVTISCGGNTSTVREGREVTRDDAADCGLVSNMAPGRPLLRGPILDSKWVGWAESVRGRFWDGCFYSDTPVALRAHSATYSLDFGRRPSSAVQSLFSIFRGMQYRRSVRVRVHTNVSRPLRLGTILRHR